MQIMQQGEFGGKVKWRLMSDGRLHFCQNIEDEASWAVYPAVALDVFWRELEQAMERHGWITPWGWINPWDLQQVACNERLATYSRRVEPYTTARTEADEISQDDLEAAADFYDKRIGGQ